MTRKFVILYTANYCTKTEFFFGIKQLIDNGIIVEHWNLSKLLLKEKYPYCSPPDGLIERDIESYQDFKQLLSKNLGALYGTPIGYSNNTFHICRIISKYNLNVLYGNYGMIPISFINSSSSFSIIQNSLRQIQFRYLHIKIISLVEKILYTTYIFKPATYLLRSSLYSTSFYKVNRNTIVVNGSSADYLCFKNSCKTISHTKPYIVFIDQNITFHPECGTLVQDKCTDPKGYFEKMNRLFDKLEKQYSCEVIVCAHPTSVIYKDSNPFFSRKIVFFQTQEYVKESIGVVTHNSTALSYAVLCHKPIILLSSNDIINNMPYSESVTQNFRKILGCKYFNIDYLECSEFGEIDDKKYNDYIKNYLSADPIHSNGEIICEIINELHKHAN